MAMTSPRKKPLYRQEHGGATAKILAWHYDNLTRELAFIRSANPNRVHVYQGVEQEVVDILYLTGGLRHGRFRMMENQGARPLRHTIVSKDEYEIRDEYRPNPREEVRQGMAHIQQQAWL